MRGPPYPDPARLAGSSRRRPSRNAPARAGWSRRPPSPLRSYLGKDRVYVLDFRNTGEEIRKAFEPYYGQTEATPSDPNVLFDAAHAVRAFDVITDQELAQFTQAWAALHELDEDRRHAVLSTSTQSAYDIARALAADILQELRDALNRFARFYGFLSQALPYIPPDTEVLYQFSKVLLRRLQSDKPQGGVDLAGQIVLTHYRIAEADAEAVTLGGDDVQPLTAITGDGTGGGAGEIPMSLLGELVDLFNERYGAELGEVDALKVMTDVRDNVRDENPDLADQAEANSRDDFMRERDNLLIGAALAVGGDRERQATLLKALLDDDDFRVRAGELIFGAIYDGYRSPPQV